MLRVTEVVSKRTYVKLGDEDVGDAADNCNEVKYVPRVLKIVLQNHFNFNVLHTTRKHS